MINRLKRIKKGMVLRSDLLSKCLGNIELNYDKCIKGTYERLWTAEKTLNVSISILKGIKTRLKELIKIF